VRVVNLDPAAEVFNYEVAIDIRDLITIDDVMEEFGFGPNGALVYCMEYLITQSDWLLEKLGDYNDDYLIFDLPGQIELYSHIGVMVKLIKILENFGYRLCAVYLLDSHFLDEPGKFIAGSLQALSAMIHLSLPHINVITKMDLLPPDTEQSAFFEKYFNADIPLLVSDLNRKTPKRFHQLATAISSVIEEYNMVSYLPLNIYEPESISLILQHVDNAIQYGEDLEPKEPKDSDMFED